MAPEGGLVARAQVYAARDQLALQNQLGRGVHGIVFVVQRHQSPNFSEEVLADWRADKQEQFESRWPEVQAILACLEGCGVFMVDVNPGNVSFSN